MTTRNLRGWRPDIPDIRDMPFSAPGELVAALPPATNNRARFTSPVYDQGEIGSCGPNSCSGDIQFDGDVAGQSLRPSRLFGYYITRHEMGTVNMDSGVSNREMLKAYAKYGWCDEDLWPYETRNYKTKPPDKAFEQAQTRRIDVYLRVPQILEQMKACLAGGDPFVFGFTVYNSLETERVRRTGIVPMPDPRADRQIGGHDVLIVDYDDAKQWFVFRNSWGVGWGDRGFGFIPYQYAVHPQLASDVWTIRWKVAPAPVPPTPPDPIPSHVPFTRSYFRDTDGREWEAEGLMRPKGSVSMTPLCPPGILT